MNMENLPSSPSNWTRIFQNYHFDEVRQQF